MRQQMRGWTKVFITLGLLLVISAFVSHGTARAVGDTVDEIKYSFGDTPNSVVFDWEGSETTIYYGVDTSYGSQATAAPSVIKPTNGVGPFMEAKLSGLQAGSVYHYRIGASGLDHTFQTIPTGDFNWVDIGDSMSTSCAGDGSWMTGQQQLIAAQQPNFVTHGGDIAVPNQCGIGSLHQYFLDQQVWSTGAAFQMALGNHEYGAPDVGAPLDAITDNNSNYKGRVFVTHAQTVSNDTAKQITHPGCGKEIGSTTNTCMGEDWGWFQASHVLYISYPEPPPDNWVSWQKSADALMASAQADPNVDFIVTWGHRPPYTDSTEGPNLNIRSALNALATKYSPTAANPTGKYILNVGHHAHSMEAFAPINGLTTVIDAAGGQGLTNWVSPIDPSSVFRMMHFGILSSHYSAASHSLTINFLCGPQFKTSTKGICTYGTNLWSKTFQSTNAPQPQPKLQMSYSDGVTSVQSGQQLTYTATLSNSGDSVVTGTTVSLQLPAGSSLVSSSDGANVSGTTVSWNTGDLAPGQVDTFQMTVLTGNLTPGGNVSSLATATDTGGACQNTGSSCSATDSDSVPQPKLQLTYSDGVSSVQSNQQLTYTATLTNNGDGTAFGTSINELLPANTSLVSTSYGSTVTGDNISWNTGDLAPGQSVNEQFTTLTGTLAGGSTLISSASATTTDTACQASGSICAATDTDTVPLPPPTTREYVTNPSIETNNTGWTGLLNSSCKAVRITTDAHDGKASLEVSRTVAPSGAAGVSAKPALVTSTVVGSNFTGSVWVRAQVPGETISLLLKETNAAGTIVGSSTVNYTAPDTAWHQMTTTYVIVGNGNSLGFVVSSPMLSVGSWFHVDSLSLIGPQ